MNVILSVTFTGVPDNDDIRTAKQTIFVENQRLLSLSPTGSALPTSSLVEVKSSYLSILSARVTADHINNIRLSKTMAMPSRFTQAEIDQMSANLIDQLNSGTGSATVVASTV